MLMGFFFPVFFLSYWKAVFFFFNGWVFVCLQLHTTLLQEMPSSAKIAGILLHAHTIN